MMGENMKNLISIVVPIYNVEKFVKNMLKKTEE